MLVRSGDAIVLAGSSRQCFHGLPRIFGASDAFSLKESYQSSAGELEMGKFMRDRRINVSVRDSK